MIYVDTSVVVALLTHEPKTRNVTEWYAGLKEVPTVSDWLLAEFSSAISIKVRTSQLAKRGIAGLAPIHYFAASLFF